MSRCLLFVRGVALVCAISAIPVGLDSSALGDATHRCYSFENGTCCDLVSGLTIDPCEPQQDACKGVIIENAAITYVVNNESGWKPPFVSMGMAQCRYHPPKCEEGECTYYGDVTYTYYCSDYLEETGEPDCPEE